MYKSNIVLICLEMLVWLTPNSSCFKKNRLKEYEKNILSNLLYMLQDDIKIFACSVAGKYFDIFPDGK